MIPLHISWDRVFSLRDFLLFTTFPELKNGGKNNVEKKPVLTKRGKDGSQDNAK